MSNYTRNPAQKRQAIVEAATQLAVAEGFANLTHRKIAQHAQVSVGTTTKYFASLDDIRLAALRTIEDELLAQINADITQLRASANPSTTLANQFNDLLADIEYVRKSTQAYAAALSDDALRELTLRLLRAYDTALLDFFSPWQASALGFIFDGAMWMAALEGKAPDPAVIANAIEAIAHHETSQK